jgi:hypothetical protein
MEQRQRTCWRRRRRLIRLGEPSMLPAFARLESAERSECMARSEDLSVRKVSVDPDYEGGSHGIVEWGDSDGGCYARTHGLRATREVHDGACAKRWRQ